MRQRPCKYTDIPFCFVFGTLSLSTSDMFISVPTGSLVKRVFCFFPKFPPDMVRLCQPHSVFKMNFKREYEANMRGIIWKLGSGVQRCLNLPPPSYFAVSHLSLGGGRSWLMKCKPRMRSLARWSCARSDGNLKGM